MHYSCKYLASILQETNASWKNLSGIKKFDREKCSLWNFVRVFQRKFREVTAEVLSSLCCKWYSKVEIPLDEKICLETIKGIPKNHKIKNKQRRENDNCLFFWAGCIFLNECRGLFKQNIPIILNTGWREICLLEQTLVEWTCFFCSEQFPYYSFDYIGMINNAHNSFIKTLTGLYDFIG